MEGGKANVNPTLWVVGLFSVELVIHIEQQSGLLFCICLKVSLRFALVN